MAKKYHNCSEYDDCCKSYSKDCSCYHKHCHHHHKHKHRFKCCCCPGPQGPQGPQGPEGPAGQLSTDYAQVFEGVGFSAVYTQPSNIQLALNAGNIFESGGFSLTSTSVPNDTINFPEDGVYLVNAQFIYSFTPAAGIVTGDVYTLDIQANTSPTVLEPTQILLNEAIGVPGGGAVTLGGTEAMNFMLNVTSVPFTLSFEIFNFSFASALNGELTLVFVAIDIIQLDEEPNS